MAVDTLFWKKKNVTKVPTMSSFNIGKYMYIVKHIENVYCFNHKVPLFSVISISTLLILLYLD